MRLVVQRVVSASVEVKGKIIGKISRGFLVFIGVTHKDTKEKIAWLAQKMAALRIFDDEKGKMNRSLSDIKGEVLIVSQFTLYADCTTGRRPSFIHAAPPEIAKLLYEKFIAEVKRLNIPVQTGIFGAEMKVSLENDGPITLLLEK